MEHIIRPIAHIRTDFTEKFGIPRQSGRAPSLTGRIVFLPEFRNPDTLRGIEEFSHLWLIFEFSEAVRSQWNATVRPPRLGGNKRVGVFASRSPFRPNSLGLSAVRLLGTEKTENEGISLVVGGADLLDMTPIYDIKPYLPFADSHEDAVGGYAENFTGHHLDVDFPDELIELLPKDKRAAAVECIADDPRPSYQDDAERVYTMSFSGFDISFRVCGECAEVIGVSRLRNCFNKNRRNG